MAIMFGIFGIMSISLNFQVGITGMVNFGHVAFVAIGAYTSALLLIYVEVPFLIALLASFITASLFGILISLPTRKLNEVYWAITTLGAAEIVRLVFLNEEWIAPGDYAGGPFGLSGIPRPLRGVIPGEYYGSFYFAIVIICLLISWFILRYITNSPFGRVLKCIREEEDLALSLSKDVYIYKIKAMALGGGFAGVGGAFWASYSTYIDPQFFMPIETFIIWAMIIVGGRGNYLGVLLGTFVVRLFYDSTRFLTGYLPFSSAFMGSLRMIIIGSLIVIFMLYKEDGLIPERKTRY